MEGTSCTRDDGTPSLRKALVTFVHPFCDHSCGGKAKFLTALKTIDWSASQLSLVYERATASNEDSSRLILE
ncbi:unnamed protein product [Prunus armeniaca]